MQKPSPGHSLQSEDRGKQQLEAAEEFYRFTWAGKSLALLEADKPTTATLRPDELNSKDWDATGNIFIEGDNLEVLKLLQKNYSGRVGMIYIDPPYNTGQDFIYKDNYRDNLANYLAITGQAGESGRRLAANAETDGRYHSNWLNMMYPRLELAKNLLTESGVIFISIGHDEFAHLTLVCNEIFGKENKIGAFVRLMKTGGNKGRFYSPNTEFILIYAKDVSQAKPFRDEISQDLVDRVYTLVEPSGPRKGERYRIMGLFQSYLEERPNQRYFIECPDGSLVIPPGSTMPETTKDGAKTRPAKGDGVWRWTYERFAAEKAKGNIVFKQSVKAGLVNEKGEQASWNVYTKIWLKDRKKEGRIPVDLIDKFENRLSSKELKELGIPFDFAKPAAMIKHLLKIAQLDEHAIVLDFFAGSGTTADAVMQLNAEENTQRKFICVQLPEPTAIDSEAYKQGYPNIAEITKERIRRAGTRLLQLFPSSTVDTGFRAFRLESSNA
jgi:adenine-specific DNA-methyltransferase